MIVARQKRNQQSCQLCDVSGRPPFFYLYTIYLEFADYVANAPMRTAAAAAVDHHHTHNHELSLTQMVCVNQMVNQRET